MGRRQFRKTTIWKDDNWRLTALSTISDLGSGCCRGESVQDVDGASGPAGVCGNMELARCEVLIQQPWIQRFFGSTLQLLTTLGCNNPLIQQYRFQQYLD